MFLTNLKHVLTTALQTPFSDPHYPEADFAGTPEAPGVYVSIEYPADRANYPGIWVDFSPTQDLESSGIGHVEYIGDGQTDAAYPAHRWRFAGQATFTIVSLSSLERDRLVDEVIRLVAFGGQTPATKKFRTTIEQNEFLAMVANFDSLSINGMVATQGTPWESDEIIYEATVNLVVIGEFVSDLMGQLVPLKRIVLNAYPEGQDNPDPDFTGAGLPWRNPLTDP